MKVLLEIIPTTIFNNYFQCLFLLYKLAEYYNVF